MLCLPVCLLSLHHPPDRKVMREPTEQKCSGESASSHLESIRCLNKVAERSLLQETASFLLGCMPALQLAPGTKDPTFQPLCWQHICAPSPSFNCGCLRIKCTPPGLLAKTVFGLYCSWWVTHTQHWLIKSQRIRQLFVVHEPVIE